MEVQETRSPQAYPKDDEIDLVELLGFLLRIKNYLIAGLLLGLASGLVALFLISKPNYSTRLSVTIDPASLPAISDAKRLSDAHQGALGSPEIVIVAFRKMLELAPDLAAKFQDRRLTLNDLVSQQTLSDRPGDTLLKVTPQVSSQDFVLEALLPETGLGKDAGRVLLVSFNEMAAEHNSRSVSLHQESSKNQVRQATRAVEEAEANSAQVQSDHEAELTRIRSDLTRMEYRLTRKVGDSPGLQRFVEIRREPQTLRIVGTAPEGAQYNPDGQMPNLDVERVLRLAGALEEEKKLTKVEADDIRKNLVTLQLGFLKNESLYSSVISANNAVMTSLYDSMAKSVVPVDRMQAFLPLFKLNEQLYTDEVARKAFEKRGGRRLPLLLVAGAMGLLAGGFLGALRHFLRKNRSKFQELSRES